jgi:hypothetical protein
VSVATGVPSVRRAEAAGPAAPASGYWLVASDGGIFAFGDAPFHGSTGALKLNRPIVGMAPTASGKGYWLVASDGGIFAFGDAAFFGSGQGRGKTIVAMTPTVTGRGYWQAAATGEVLSFGDARDLGSARVNNPLVGMARTASGAGYWLVAGDGGIFSFGDARFLGSTGAIRLNQPIVGLGIPSPPATSGTSPTAPGPSNPGPTTPGPTTPPPGDPADPPTQYETERISPPMQSPNGGTNTADLPTSGTDCGFPSAPQKTDLGAETDYVGEASGLVASQRYPGYYWMIRDGASNPRRDEMYAVRFSSSGMVQSRPVPIPGAFNGDWEEINYGIGPDGRARLWITESGQGTSMGVFDEIYEVLEPDPATATSAELLNTYEYQYPDRSYNTEAAFIHRGLLVMVAKVTPHARAYRFERLVPIDELAPGADPLDHNARQKNVPTYIGNFGNSKDVSVIRQSPDGKLLITASHQVVHMYRSTDGSGSLKSFLGRLPDCELMAFPDGNVEAGEFSGNAQMVFLDELKKSYRLTLAP